MVEKCEKKMNLFFGHLQLLVATTITYIIRSTHKINAIRCGTSTYFKENTFYIRIFQPPQNTLKSILIKSQLPLMKSNKIHNSHSNILICTFHLCINIQLAIYAKCQNQYKYWYVSPFHVSWISQPIKISSPLITREISKCPSSKKIFGIIHTILTSTPPHSQLYLLTKFSH